MNHIYRLIRNHITNAWVCCSENANGRGKSGSGGNSAVVGMVVLTAVALVSFIALADLTGGKISTGVDTIAQVGNTTTITQNCQNLAINWQNFSIAANEAVRFAQPNPSSIVLNRITGQNPSQILGSFRANGRVFVLNPNGVQFGVGSQVNVGGKLDA